MFTSAVRAQSVDFESLSEGFLASDITISGVRFFEGIGLPGDPPGIWAADAASGVWDVYFKVLDFVQGTQLNLSAYSRSPDIVAFAVIRSLKIAPPEPTDYVSLSVLYRVFEDNRNYALNTMKLEAYRDGRKVGESDEVHPDNVLFDTGRSTSGASRLELSGVEFDMIQLQVRGPTNLGTILGGIDNVRFDRPAIPCGDVKKLTARCKPGRIKARLKLRGFDHDGDMVRYRIDRDLFEARVKGNKARIKHAVDPGTYNLGIVEPMGCVAAVDVAC